MSFSLQTQSSAMFLASLKWGRSFMARKISVRLNNELLAKIENWRAKGISLSDTVRQALILLPNSPEEMLQIQTSQIKVKPLRKAEINIELNETDALKTLQEW